MSILKVRLRGFDEEIALFGRAVKGMEPALEKALQRYGDRAIAMLRERVLSNQMGLPPKHRPNGKPPLVDSEKYIRSLRAQAERRVLGIYADGMNDHMSNEQLSDVLEYGAGNIPAKPHIRPTVEWMEKNQDQVVEEVFDELFGDS